MISLKNKSLTKIELGLLLHAPVLQLIIEKRTIPIVKNFRAVLFLVDVKELLISIRSILIHCLFVRFRKTSTAIISIGERNHLDQVLGVYKYMIKYNPIYITNKRKLISIIKEHIPNAKIVFIPNFHFAFRFTVLRQFKNAIHQNLLQLKKTDMQIHVSIINALIQQHLFTRFILKVCNKKQIRFVLTFNDLVGIGRPLVLSANEANIHSIYMMHGLLSDESIESLHLCKSYLIFGEYTRPILVNNNIPTHSIYTIGTPYLHYKKNHKSIFEIIIKKSILSFAKNNRKIILITLSGRGHTTSANHHDAIISLLSELIRKVSNDYFFVFKLHPKDEIKYYNLLFEHNNENSFRIFTNNHFGFEESIFDWIKCCNILITGASTSALEAMYLLKPVITVDLKSEYESETLFIKNKATYHARNLEEVICFLQQIENNEYSTKLESIHTAESYFSTYDKLDDFFQTKFDRILNIAS